MKKFFKKPMMFLVAALFLVALTACGSGEEASSDSTESKDSDKKISINVAYGNQPGEPLDQQAKKWKELAEEKSGGKLELKLYPSSQLGSEKDVVEQAIMGNNVIIFTGYDFLMDYVPDAGIYTAPYLTESFDDLLYLTTTDWQKELVEKLKAEGIEIVNTNTVYGARHLMTTEPVTSIDDLKGMKIRVPNNQMYIKTFESLGATPTPMPLADLYTSLQQGLVDGAENPLPVLNGTKTQEVAKHLTLTEHTKIISPWIAGTSFVETIPADLYEILVETGIEAGEFGREVTEKEAEEVLAQFKEEGIEVHEVDLAPFKEAAKEVYTGFPNWSPNLYETVQELLANR
ncbi:C4-dicarboxylate TRAP transporter substrate-binding protein [Bacillus dakarensis]|uniref:C4-dicarboxylate TRAP transporter substrate-binding protein n=1 Tax=Robertmurraya dakarensis TaxID=1926278 RepID=UPI0009810D26|nr:C4-dicarboxylate TRAP transporter substrate-binding protein [Bacillus dakarensis]